LSAADTKDGSSTTEDCIVDLDRFYSMNL